MVRKFHLKSQIGKKKKGFDYPGPTFPKDKNWLKLSSFPMSPHGSLKALLFATSPPGLQVFRSLQPRLGGFELCPCSACWKQSVTGLQWGLSGRASGI